MATAEFVRTHGPGAFLPSGDWTDEKQLSHDEALREAGSLGEAALKLAGISPSAASNQSTRAQSALLAFVRQLAEGPLVESDSGLALSVAASGAAHPVLELARTEQGADLWLGRQIARAATVVADAAQVDADWLAVQRYTTLGIAALLSSGYLPTALPDVLALVRLLNRLGVSHRARWGDGLWWAEQAAAHHEAAIVLLRGRRPSSRAGDERQLTQDYMLNCFTTLTNLASAWTEVVHAGGETVDDLNLRRAHALLKGQLKGKANEKQYLAHRALHHGRSPACKNPEECLPSSMLDQTFEGNANYKPWTWVLRNDLAEVNWRIAMHEIKGRPRSGWTATKQPVNMQTCTRSAVQIHQNTIAAISEELEKVAAKSENTFFNSEVAVAKYWRWQHQKNLRDKVYELQKYGHDDLIEKLLPAKGLQELNTTLAGSQPVHQLATLDAYHSTLHQVVLRDDVSDDRR